MLYRIKDIFGLNDPPPPPPASRALLLRNLHEAGLAAPSLPLQAPQDRSSVEEPVAEGNAAARLDATPAPVVESNPYPHITEAQWEAREPVRQLLENILTRHVRILEGQHRDMLRKMVAGPSPHERAAEVAPAHANNPLMQRLEDSSLRRVLRISNLLLRMRREERLRGDI